jgi:hypothetical protein
MTNDDVWLLINEGYGLTDIAMMFGLSRERVRQKAAQIGLEYSQGTKPRVWDDQLGRFRFRAFPEWRAERRAERRLRRRIKLEFTAARKRDEQVAAVRQLFNELGRTPTLWEIVGRCGYPAPASIYATWGYGWVKKCTPGEASAALYTAAGLQKRSPGWPGWRARN